jgi:hypothetical protein
MSQIDAVFQIRSLRLVAAILITSVFLFIACRHTVVDPSGPPIIPTFAEINVRDNENNVLSAVVAARAINAAAIAVEYGLDSLFSQSTPFVPIQGDSAQVPILGLEANQSYLMRAVAISMIGHKTISRPFTFSTPSLPDDLPSLSVLTHQSPSTGFVMLGFTSSGNPNQSYALIIDNHGKAVWYRAFRSPVADFQKQANGSYTAFSSADGSSPHFYELDQLGRITREFRASNGLETGAHEIKFSEDGHCLFGITFREMDLTSIGGMPNAIVRGMIVEYHRSNGQSLFWSPFDHFQVTDAAPDVSLTGPHVNPWHGNAIEVDTDGHLLVSFRNSDEVTKINSQTGEIIWRLGGRNNQFTFVNDPLNGFSHQHGIRRVPNGNIILFDNGNLHSPPMSRAVEYKLDEIAKVAELVWEYRHDPPLYGFALGFAQRLANGNTLICYGIAQRIIEVDGIGVKRWELSIDSPSLYAYRAFRIDSLY